MNTFRRYIQYRMSHITVRVSFDTPADDLLAAIRDTADPLLSKPPNQYVFPELILTLWGLSAQYDHRGGRTRPVFAAVEIETPHYLAAIRAIKV